MKYAFTFAALAAVASGHSIFQQIVVAGTEYGLGVGIRKPSYNGVCSVIHMGRDMFINTFNSPLKM